MSEQAAKMPGWMSKYPCPSCSTGYGQCHELVRANWKCCKDCTHPDHTAAQPHPWTAEELEDMWSGREMPAYIVKEMAWLRR